MTVRLARPADLPATAQLHRRCLPGGFFVRLGAGFLGRYHATFVAGPRATLLVAERGGEVIGFLAGTVDNAQHYRSVLRRPPVGLVVSGGAGLLRDRRLAADFVRTRASRYLRAVLRQLRPRRRSGGATPGDRRPVAVLTHVAVTDGARRSGAGRHLVAAFVQQVRAGGVGEVRLVTAVDGGGPSFYRGLGWASLGPRRAADGTVVEEFVLEP